MRHRQAEIEKEAQRIFELVSNNPSLDTDAIMALISTAFTTSEKTLIWNKLVELDCKVNGLGEEL